MKEDIIKSKKMKSGLIELLILLAILAIFQISIAEFAAAQPNEQNKFDAVRKRSLISDFKAMGVGDAVKVLIVESTEAGNSAGANETRNSSLSGGVGAGTSGGGFDADLGISTGNDFKGSGANTRKESIRSQLTAKVVGEDERGNYVIEGNRRTKIDGEDQTITLRGVIRAVDIRSDNSIYSYNIMDLELSVEGEGNATKMREPGLFTRFFRMLF
jgi:flagellar L-ring protein precursor FlgH